MNSTYAQPNRRDFLSAAAAGGLAGMVRPGRLLAADPQPVEKIAFYLVGDTHFLADRDNPGKLSGKSNEICGRLVDVLNRLPGQEIPAAAGGGRVAEPAGVIHAGDVIDTGDKQGSVHAEMQKSEWAAFSEQFGLSGKDGRLKFPVYEIHGNHDAPHGTGLAIEKIVERNKKRPGVANVSKNGVHYSWDWGNVHFLNLGLIVGNDDAVERKRRYAALGSYDFLVSDLRDKVGTSGRPIVITHHIDIARYTGPCDQTAPADAKEWDPCDVHAFHDALSGFNVAGIFYGHTHARNVFRWDGESPKAGSGLHVFNNDNSSHFSSDTQAFFYVEIDKGRLLVREYHTKDRWLTGAFTPQTWTASFAA